MNCSALNAHLFIRNLFESPNCICGIIETVGELRKTLLDVYNLIRICKHYIEEFFRAKGS